MRCPLCTYDRSGRPVDEGCPECGLPLVAAIRARTHRNARGLLGGIAIGMLAGLLLVGLWELSAPDIAPASLGRALLHQFVLSGIVGGLCLLASVRRVPLWRSVVIVAAAVASPWLIFLLIVPVLVPVFMFLVYFPAAAGAVLVPSVLASVMLRLTTQPIPRR